MVEIVVFINKHTEIAANDELAMQQGRANRLVLAGIP